LIEAHVLSEGEDTTVPILANGKPKPAGSGLTSAMTGRSRQGPPAALYYASRDRSAEHPERHLKSYTSILQADAYGAPTGSTSPIGGRADH
jgi:hypothetical protein